MKVTAVKFILITSLIFVSPSLWADENFCQSTSQTINQAADDFWQYGSYSDTGFDETKYPPAYANFDQLIKQILNDKRSLTCDWKELSSIKVARSPDKKLRSFSWDLATGGTLHEFGGVIQSQDKDGNIILNETLPNDNEVGLISAIYQLSLSNQSAPVYVLNRYMIGSTALRMETINLYQLNKGVLQPLNLIQTRQLTDSLAFEYNVFTIPKSWENKPLIQIDSQKNQISLPVILDKNNDGMGKVTDRRIVYEYNGRVFERIKP